MDVEIVQKAKTGDSHALEEIYNETRQMVYFTALGIVRNEDDAEDVVQDTYIKVFQNIARLQDEKAFISWLKMIVVNVSKNNLKKCRPMLFQNDEEEVAVLGSIEEVGEEFLPQEYVDQAEKREIIKTMIENLPDAQRTAVMLYYFDELPLSEVSKVMETTEGTTKSRLNYARKQIRVKVDEQEKKGSKLYAGVPMLTRILHLVSQNCDLPAETAKHILAHSLQEANIAAGETASSAAAAGSEAADQAAIADQASAALESSAAGTAVKASAAKGILAKIVGMSAQTKLIALIAAGVVVAGSGTGAALAVKHHNDAVQAAIVLQQKQKAESKAKAKAASEAAAKKKAEEEAAAKAASSQKAEASSEASADVQAQNMQLYKAYYDANLKNNAKAVFFVDLTHDGVDDMLVTSSDPAIGIDPTFGISNGSVDVYTIVNGQPAKIYDRYYDTSHASFGAEYLYQENGLNYLFEPYDQQPNAWGDNVANRTEIAYSVFFLDTGGNRKEYKSDQFDSVEYNDGRIEYAQPGDTEQQKQHESAVEQGMKDYATKSKLILQAEWSGDITFANGDPDPFGESTDSTVTSSSSQASSMPSSSSQVASSESYQHPDGYHAEDFYMKTLDEVEAVLGKNHTAIDAYGKFQYSNIPFVFYYNEDSKKIDEITITKGGVINSTYKCGMTDPQIKQVTPDDHIDGPYDYTDEDEHDEYDYVYETDYVLIFGWSSSDVNQPSEQVSMRAKIF